MKTLVFTLFALSVVTLFPSFTQAQVNQGFTNPLGSTSINSFLTSVISYILGVASLLALLALIVGGTRLIIGFGNEDQLKSAKTIIKWAIIGLIVVVLSYVIVRLVAVGFLGVQDAS
ncbi:MAG: hypothetical protein WD972_03365 [Candidatus Andersenbacteria bacterium]